MTFREGSTKMGHVENKPGFNFSKYSCELHGSSLSLNDDDEAKVSSSNYDDNDDDDDEEELSEWEAGNHLA
jgi:hypothetical protein